MVHAAHEHGGVILGGGGHDHLLGAGVQMDLCPADYLAYMLKYDTMHGQFAGTVESTENSIIVNVFDRGKNFL